MVFDFMNQFTYTRDETLWAQLCLFLFSHSILINVMYLNTKSTYILSVNYSVHKESFMI